jgi:hypothetical protein
MEIFCLKKRNLNGLLFYLWLFFFIRSLQKKKEEEKFSFLWWTLFGRILPIPYWLEGSGPFPRRRLGRLLSFNFLLSISLRDWERKRNGELKRNFKKQQFGMTGDGEKKKGKVFVFFLHLEMDPSNLSRELVSLYLFIWNPAATTTTSITTPFCC